MNQVRSCVLGVTTALLAGVMLAGAASFEMPGLLPGPPIMCNEIAIGDAKSLPRGEENSNSRNGRTASGVVDDTMKLLKMERNCLVRMETMRRATQHVARDRSAALDLLVRVQSVALEQEAAGRADAQAWFDVGFLLACYDQSELDWGLKSGVEGGVIGYAFVKKSLALADDATRQFGAALMTVPVMRSAEHRSSEDYDRHIRAAAAGAEKGSLLEKNLAVHLEHWGSSLDQVRAAAKKGDGAADARAKK